MLRRLLPLTALVPATLMMTTLVHADATADAKKVIAADYAKIDAAANRKDADGMMAFYTPDYTYTAKNGRTFTLEQAKQQARTLTSTVQSIKAHSQLLSFKLKGSTAIATTREHAELGAINPQNNQPLKFVIDASSEYTWVKSGAKWLVKKSKEISRTMTMNGKPVGGK